MTLWSGRQVVQKGGKKSSVGVGKLVADLEEGRRKRGRSFILFIECTIQFQCVVKKSYEVFHREF